MKPEPTPAARAPAHLRAEAHRLLDRAKAGDPVHEVQILRALRCTGDLPDPPEPLLATPVASFLNRSGRVMRGAGDIVSEAA